jgi:hypothetical protein
MTDGARNMCVYPLARRLCGTMDQVNTNIGFFDIEISDLTISPAVVMAQGRDRCGFSRKSTRLSARAWLMFAGGRI